jgi:hypothetical protein
MNIRRLLVRFLSTVLRRCRVAKMLATRYYLVDKSVREELSRDKNKRFKA